MSKQAVYCKECKRLYKTGADQCDIPNPGIFDEGRINYFKAVGLYTYTTKNKERIRFLKEHQAQINLHDDGTVYGHPSMLNRKNNCPFFEKKKRWWFFS